MELTITLIPLGGLRVFYTAGWAVHHYGRARALRRLIDHARQMCDLVELEHGRKFECRLCTVRKRRCVEVKRVA